MGKVKRANQATRLPAPTQQPPVAACGDIASLRREALGGARYLAALPTRSNIRFGAE